MLNRLFGSLAVVAALSSIAAMAQSPQPLTIAVLNDMSGVYSDFQGPGSVIAAELAVQDFGGTVKGRPIKVVSADHQNKVDVGAAIVGKWFDVDNVDLVLDVPNSAIALAVSDLARRKNKTFIASGGVTSLLTGEKCSPNTVQWTFDNWSLANSLVEGVIKTGGDSWFFLTSDYAFGHDLEATATAAINARNGKVMGAVRHPIGTADFSSFLLQAQSSKAKIVALANAGGDTTNAIKQAIEYRLPQGGQRLAGLVFLINNVHALGLEQTEKLYSVSPFVWNRNEQTRNFAKRFQSLHVKKNMPNEMQAGVYASVLHYLKAVDALDGVSEGDKVVAKMKELKTSDPLFGEGTIRIDGRKLHPMYLLEVKSRQDSKEPWDYFNVVETIPADRAFRPLNQGGCPLVK
jgi:branched-chain amino acid transport system substrate-binding protein